MAEWLNAAVLKTVVGETQPGVRIPPPPPHSPDAEERCQNSERPALRSRERIETRPKSVVLTGSPPPPRTGSRFRVSVLSPSGAAYC